MLHYGILPPYLPHTTTYISPPSYYSRYVSSTHPIRIDTADIDVFRARPIRTSATCVQREIHRNRSVVRLTTTRNGKPQPPRSPGARLVEKFRIKDPRTAEIMLQTEESSIKNYAINQVRAECDKVSVPIVESCDQCETVIVPLKKNRVKNNKNENEITISLKTNKTKSNLINNNPQTCVNIKLPKNFQNKSKNNLNKEVLINSSENLEHKLINNSEISELDREDSKQVGTSIDILPKLPHSTNKSTNYVVQLHQNEQKSTDCFVGSDIYLKEEKSIINDETLTNCPSKQKETIRKNLKLEKVGRKQGKKLKITEVSTDFDDIKRCAKIDVNCVDGSNNSDLVSRTDVRPYNNNNNNNCLTNTEIIVEQQQPKSELHTAKLNQKSAPSSELQQQTNNNNSKQTSTQQNIKLKELPSNKYDNSNKANDLLQNGNLNDANTRPWSSELLKNSQSSISSKITEETLRTSSILSDSAEICSEKKFKQQCSSINTVITQQEHDNTSERTLSHEKQNQKRESVDNLGKTVPESLKSESEKVRLESNLVNSQNNEDQKPKFSLASEKTKSSDDKKSESEKVRLESSLVDSKNNQDQKLKFSLASDKTKSVCDDKKSESEKVRLESSLVDSKNNQDQKPKFSLASEKTKSSDDKKSESEKVRLESNSADSKNNQDQKPKFSLASEKTKSVCDDKKSESEKVRLESNLVDSKNNQDQKPKFSLASEKTKSVCDDKKSESEKVRLESNLVDSKNNQDQKPKFSLASEKTKSVCDDKKSESEKVRLESSLVDSKNNQDQKPKFSLASEKTKSSDDKKSESEKVRLESSLVDSKNNQDQKPKFSLASEKTKSVCDDKKSESEKVRLESNLVDSKNNQDQKPKFSLASEKTKSSDDKKAESEKVRLESNLVDSKNNQDQKPKFSLASEKTKSSDDKKAESEKVRLESNLVDSKNNQDQKIKFSLASEKTKSVCDDKKSESEKVRLESNLVDSKNNQDQKTKFSLASEKTKSVCDDKKSESEKVRLESNSADSKNNQDQKPKFSLASEKTKSVCDDKKSESEKVKLESNLVDSKNNQDQKPKFSLASEKTKSVCDDKKSESEKVRLESNLVDSKNNQDQKSIKNLQNLQNNSDSLPKLNAKSDSGSNKLEKGKVKKKKASKGSSKNKVAGSKKKQQKSKGQSSKKEAEKKTGVLLDEEEFEDEGLGKDCSVKTSDGSSSFDSDWEQVEIEEMEGGVKKKKLIVRKKGTKVTVTPLELKPPAIVENEAKGGQIIRQLSQKRVSLVDEDLGFLDIRKMSITDEIIVEQAAVFDDMISKELKTSDRRKSSLGMPALEQSKAEPEKPTSPNLQDRRREIWKNKLRTSGKTLGKFYKPVVQQESDDSSDSSDEDEECDVNCHRKCQRLMPNLCGVNHKLVAEALSKLKKTRRSRRSSTTCSSSSSALDQDGTVSTSLSSISLRNSSDTDSFTEGAAGRVTPPAKTLPKFRTYSIKDFQFLKVLGKGSFGKVLLAELKGSECYYAVKCLKKDVVLEDDDVECTMIERKVLALGTGHPYFCHLFCTFQTQSHLFFVMEYLNGGDLMFHIQQSGRFDEGRARFYAAEIVCGLTFLHKWGIVYRDLKLDNILLDFDGHVRIADFGMCKLQIYLDKTTDTFCGTPDYMAPEIIKGLKYNQCVDWWSFGILLYEMLVGQSPFSGCDEDDLFWSICNMRPHFPRHLSNQAKSILNAFLEKDWTKRLGSSENSASDVMNHEFFSGLKWHLLERRQLEPPFKPNMRHPLDTKYFDRAFTSEKPVLTPVDPSILESMDQTQFQGFSYTNPNATE